MAIFTNLSTRPFLSTIEKKWICFQLLSGLVEVHARFKYHGDIKSENVMITSWNWAYLCDFASYKPVSLPDDNPSTFSFFFDASFRRSCYIAPERFVSLSPHPSLKPTPCLTPEMDIFSLGCTMAEVFLEGTPLFTLSQLLQYRKKEYDPSHSLEKIDDTSVRAMIKHMIQLVPEDRYTAQKYLSDWRNTAFPESFYSFLYPFIASLSDPVSSESHNVILSENSNTLVTDCDARIDQIYKDFRKIAKVLGLTLNPDPETVESKVN